MKKEILVRKIETEGIIDETEDLKFLVNDKINLYVKLDRGITTTLLSKIKTPFIISIEADQYSTENTIPSHCNFEIIINHSDFKTEDYIRTPSIKVKGKRNEQVIKEVIERGFTVSIEDTLIDLDSDFNEIGIKELIEFKLKSRIISNEVKKVK